MSGGIAILLALPMAKSVDLADSTTEVVMDSAPQAVAGIDGLCGGEARKLMV